jgi:hypothetical protein
MAFDFYSFMKFLILMAILADAAFVAALIVNAAKGGVKSDSFKMSAAALAVGAVVVAMWFMPVKAYSLDQGNMLVSRWTSGGEEPVTINVGADNEATLKQALAGAWFRNTLFESRVNSGDYIVYTVRIHGGSSVGFDMVIQQDIVGFTVWSHDGKICADPSEIERIIRELESQPPISSTAQR